VLIIGNGRMARLAQRELEDTYLYVALHAQTIIL